MSGPITGIGQIHVSVTDLARSVRFYRDVLGLKLLFEVPGQPMAFFDCGGVRLYLGVPENPDFRSRPVIYYQVPDIQAAHKAIVERGGKSEGAPHVVHRDGKTELWMAAFKDPDGNHVLIMAEVQSS